MGTMKDRIISKCLNINSGILLLAYCLLLTVFVTACGRKADPVWVPSYDKKTISEDKSKDRDAVKESGNAAVEKEKPVTQESETAQPEAPSGLAAVYTGKGIVLVWKEIIGQGVKGYRVYRSSGGEFILVGETVSPAFTDKDITQRMTYRYRITAVGKSESILSEEILITTEIK